ncbi:MAG: hypothetical protein ACLTYF_22625 [Escherichia sp.]
MIGRFQKGRAINAGYVYPASFDRLLEVAGMVVVLFVSIPFVAMVGRNPTI